MRPGIVRRERESHYRTTKQVLPVARLTDCGMGFTRRGVPAGWRRTSTMQQERFWGEHLGKSPGVIKTTEGLDEAYKLRGTNPTPHVKC